MRCPTGLMMLNLSDNLYNKQLGRHESKLKLWRYAGLLLTYRCTAACRFCYYRCGPDAGGLMSVQTAIDCWHGLERIAGQTARVHLAGGEPFLYAERLAEICTEARRLGFNQAESVETNASWVAGLSDRDVRDRLAFLNDCNVSRLKISWDPFHEEFVEIEHVNRLVRIAGQVLGPERVLVRWQKYLDEPAGIKSMSEAAKNAVFREALKLCRFTGRAAETLAPLAECSQVESFTGRHCQSSLLDAKGVHVDPEGNIFVGQCSGMIVGNVGRAGLDEVWRAFEPNKMDFWSVLFRDGPVGFLPSAVQAGYKVRPRYASKCHLCTDLRCFFFDKGRYSSIIGPSTCYPEVTKGQQLG